MGINNKYYKNQEVKHNGVTLSITAYGTVYQISNKGNRKLDTLYIKKLGVLAVALLDGTNIQLVFTKNGVKVKA